MTARYSFLMASSSDGIWAHLRSKRWNPPDPAPRRWSERIAAYRSPDSTRLARLTAHFEEPYGTSACGTGAAEGRNETVEAERPCCLPQDRLIVR